MPPPHLLQPHPVFLFRSFPYYTVDVPRPMSQIGPLGWETSRATDGCEPDLHKPRAANWTGLTCREAELVRAEQPWRPQAVVSAQGRMLGQY